MGGMSAALCLAVMLTTALMPFATYALPALAGVLLVPVAMELGIKTGWVSYVAVAILSLLIVPDREAALMFIAFFGYYPMLKLKTDRIKRRILRWTLKLAIFNAAMILSYGAVIYVFGLTFLLDEFAGGFGWILLAIGNICFPVYELAVNNMYRFYILRVRKTIFKS